MEFKHNKALGQNFLTDTNLLAAIAADAGVTATDNVAEVGAGAGALTLQLAKTGANVVAYELDERLLPILNGIAADFPRLLIRHADILKVPDDEIFAEQNFTVVANLPYYITTPVLFKFLENPRARSVTVMVQREVAERIVASPGGKDYGVLSVTAQLSGNARITRRVSRTLFTPPPSVDSAVVRIDVTASVNPDVRKLVRAAFAMRRKTLVNNLSASLCTRARAEDVLTALGLPLDVRAERLSPQLFVTLTDMLKK